MSLRNVATLLGAGQLPAFFPDSPSRKQENDDMAAPDWLDKMSPGPPAHWKKGRAVGRTIQTSEKVELSVVNGFGKVIYPDSSIYVGTMKDRLRDGEGCFSYADGGEYMGQWLGGKKHGIGIMIFFSKARYAGEWRNGMRHGYGRYEWAPVSDSQQHLRSPSDINTFHDAYSGQWENDKMHGLGQLESAHDSLEIGNFENGKMHGYGMRILKSVAREVTAATILSGDAIMGKSSVFVGYFETDVFFGVRNREQEEEFQRTDAARLDKPWDPFAKLGGPKKSGETASPKKHPRMNQRDFDTEFAAQVAVIYCSADERWHTKHNSYSRLLWKKST